MNPDDVKVAVADAFAEERRRAPAPLTAADVKAQVTQAIKEDRDRQPKDTYRTPIQFFLGVSTLALALIAAIVTALVSDHALDDKSPLSPMLGGALAGVTVSLFLAVFLIAVLQGFKISGFRLNAAIGAFLMLVVNLSGLIALSFALRGAAALLGRSATLPSLEDALRQIWMFLW